jgi:hypothetical protein
MWNSYFNRRRFLGQSSLGVGSIALAAMSSRARVGATQGPGQVHPALEGLPHFAPKAKFICT